MKVRWPNGYESELKQVIAERIARKNGCTIIGAQTAPEPPAVAAASVPPSLVPHVAPVGPSGRGKKGRR